MMPNVTVFCIIFVEIIWQVERAQDSKCRAAMAEMKRRWKLQIN